MYGGMGLMEPSSSGTQVIGRSDSDWTKASYEAGLQYPDPSEVWQEALTDELVPMS